MSRNMQTAPSKTATEPINHGATDIALSATVPPDTRRLKLKPGHPFYCVRRVEPRLTGDGGGWLVVVTRGKLRFAATFSDANFQNQQTALQAAQAFRDALLARMPAKKIIATRTKTAMNGSVPGVHRRIYNDVEYWTAKTRTDEKVREKKFSVRKHGEAEARRLAMDTGLSWLSAAGFEDMTRPGPTSADIDQIEKAIRARFGETAPAPRGGFAGFKELDMYGIGRQEANTSGKFGSWKVVLVRRGVRHQRTFYDNSHGGRDAGLLAAQTFRDEILRAVPPLTKRELHVKAPANNTSGVVGVRLVQTRGGKRNAWVASLCTDGIVQTKRFSAAQYGDQLAYSLAVEARAQMVDSVRGYRTPSPALKGWIESLPAD